MKTKVRILTGVATVLVLALMLPSPAIAAKRPTVAPKVVITCAQVDGVEYITDTFTGLQATTHTEQTKLYTPDGGLYQTFTQQFVPTNGGYTVTHVMPIVGTWAERLPGTWTVKVYLDGVVLGTGTFVI